MKTLNISALVLSVIIFSCNKDENNEVPNAPAGNGVYAVYSMGGQWANRKAFLWKDEVQTNLSNEIQQSNLYVTAVAVSSTGDVYVAGGEGLKLRQDYPNSHEYVDNVNTVLWKNGVKQKLNATPVPRWYFKGQDVDLAINSNDDVFVLGRDGSTDAGKYSVWKNGNRIIELHHNNANLYPYKIVAKENDIYVCGYIEGSSTPHQAALWKNGVLQNLNVGLYLYANCVSVSDNNDVYVGFDDGTLLKNNVAQTMLHSAAGNAAFSIEDIVCTGKDVYVLGYTTCLEWIIWKNGAQLYQLTPETPYTNLSAQSLFVSGDDVFTSCVLANSASTAAVIYKNGTLYKTMYNGNGFMLLADAPSVFVK